MTQIRILYSDFVLRCKSGTRNDKNFLFYRNFIVFVSRLYFTKSGDPQRHGSKFALGKEMQAVIHRSQVLEFDPYIIPPP